MIRIQRTNSDDPAFRKLVKLLDERLAILDGEEHAFYARFNKTDSIKHALVAYKNDEAVGCGAIRAFGHDRIEVKRMYVLPKQRGKGVASMLLRELEQWCAEMNYTQVILETGKKQTEAIGLYKKRGYCIIPSYGSYKNAENSICFQKELQPDK